MKFAENAAIELWLEKESPEEVLEPDLPIIDPHHHLWDLRTLHVEPFASFEQKVYLIDEILSDIAASGHNVVQTVFAQCNAFYRADGPEAMRPVGETEFAGGIAAMSRSGGYGSTRLCAGIFSAADLRDGAAVRAVLEAHLAASSSFRGIRSAFPRNLDPGFLEGFAVLGSLGLTFDNYSPDPTRLPVLAELARLHPQVTIIVNHLGGRVDPETSAADFDAWRASIDTVARCPNVVMKLGGAQQRVGPWEPPFHMHRRESPIGSEALSELVLPWYRHALEAFGPERCMFESNFPVDKECVSYRTIWNTFKRIAHQLGLSDAEKADVFNGTAARAYRLDPITAD